MNPRLMHKARVLRHIFKDCYREVDGSWVYGPMNFVGSLTAADLKMIAELLDEANRVWDLQVERELCEG